MGSGPMSEDTRNQGLVGMSDGIPLFRDKSSRSAIPVLLRTTNMGDHLSMKFRYTHMTGLVPSHFWIIGKDSKQFQRVERKPSTLMAILHAVTDNLLFWEEGELVEDHSKCAQDPRRWFQLRAALLYWCGDYPGQGEASGFSHAAGGKHSCHWCEICANKEMAINRMKYADYYRCVHYQSMHVRNHESEDIMFCAQSFTKEHNVSYDMLTNNDIC
jgi:hypothetical protein